MKNVLFLAALLLILHLPCRAQSIDSMITTWQDNGLFNGGVIVIQKGHVVYQRSAGYANFETGTPNTETTPFNLASVSKPFTAIAILQLVHKNKLKLSDALIQYLPDFPYPAVTIEQLLSHTSGLPEADQFEKPYFNEILSNRKIYTDLLQLNLRH